MILTPQKQLFLHDIDIKWGWGGGGKNDANKEGGNFSFITKTRNKQYIFHVK